MYVCIYILQATFPYIVDNNARLVAATLSFFSTQTSISHSSAFPQSGSIVIEDNQVRNILMTEWGKLSDAGAGKKRTFQNRTSQSKYIEFLALKLNLLHCISKYMTTFGRQEISRLQHIASHSNFYHLLLECLKKEAEDTCGEVMFDSFTAEDTSKDESVFVIYDREFLENTNSLSTQCQILVASSVVIRGEASDFSINGKILPPTLKVNLMDKDIKSLLGSAAPSFGIRNEVKIFGALKDAGFVITADSLRRLLHLQNRQICKYFVCI
jgi:hypothetical protein